MRGSSHRSTAGGRIARESSVRFTFDGRSYSGHPGDTLASALLANGVSLFGRSFKYHRPRGVYTSGSEEPNALVTLGVGGRREPNIPATTVEIFDGLVAQSQNRWPSLRCDLLSANSLLQPLLPAGFYYKTFMWPRSFWYRLYEPAIRRAAGLGCLAAAPDPDRYEHAAVHCDVLVVGAGPAGMTAALAAASAGAQVLLVDEQPSVGGHLLGESIVVDGQPADRFLAAMHGRLAARANLRLLLRTTVFGRYDGLTFGAVERVSDHLGAGTDGGPRQRRWMIHARRFVCAAGAIERPLVFDGNDRPGVMLAGAARTYLNRFGVVAGRRAVVFTNNDDAYRTARDLSAAGAAVTIVDSRPEGRVSGAELLDGKVDVRFAHSVERTWGGRHVRAVTISPVEDDGGAARLECDLVCVSGGWNPTIHLLSHCGGRPRWDDSICSFVMPALEDEVQAVGGARGTFDLQAVLREGATAGRAAARSCGLAAPEEPFVPSAGRLPSYGIEPRWRTARSVSRGKTAFVDLQSDVTVADLELSAREGLGHPEHAKRYTALGMATDQGKLANVNALGILSELRGCPIAETGTTTFRPFFAAPSLGALAGQARGEHFRPLRRSPIHDWHAQHGAVFTHAGLWLRPHYYPRSGEDFAMAVEREVRKVRDGVGLADMSTLGKIEIKGPDGGAFLDLLYINTMSKLRVGATRYGVMLREDGMVLDDGVVARLGADHFVISTTTANAEQVMRHLEFCQQVLWPAFDVQLCSVTESWAAIAVAGPRARDVLRRALTGLDLGDGSLPQQGVAEAAIANTPARVFRISFSGENAYEVHVPAASGPAVWEAIVAAGRADDIAPYGMEALTVLRLEKGHVAGPELDGTTTADDLGLARMMAPSKECVGRQMAGRPGLVAPGRHQLVGVRAAEREDIFHQGAHLVIDPDAVGPEASQGHLTTTAYSPTCGCTIGLALLKDGRQRLGERLFAVSPVLGERAAVIVTEPVFVDPGNERRRV